MRAYGSAVESQAQTEIEPPTLRAFQAQQRARRSESLRVRAWTAEDRRRRQW